LSDLRTLAASVGGALHVEEPHGRLADVGSRPAPARAFFAYPVIRGERVEEALADVGATAVAREARPPSDRPVHVVTVTLED
jgi:hypothetical protein